MYDRNPCNFVVTDQLKRFIFASLFSFFAIIHPLQAETFSSVTTGGNHTCALKTDKTVVCWGEDFSGESIPPQEEFLSIKGSGDNTCGLTTSGSVSCWGLDYFYGDIKPSSEQFIYLGRGDNFYTCGIKPDQSIECWGDVKIDEIPTGQFAQVSASRSHTCALTVDNQIQCWRDALPIEGVFSQVAVGPNYSCGITSDEATVKCQGDNTYGKATPPPDVQFISLSLGWGHACGVKTDGFVACWGNNSYGQAIAPQEQFLEVSVGDFHSCGITLGNELLCWGDNMLDQYPTLATGKETPINNKDDLPVDDDPKAPSPADDKETSGNDDPKAPSPADDKDVPGNDDPQVPLPADDKETSGNDDPKAPSPADDKDVPGNDDPQVPLPADDKEASVDNDPKAPLPSDDKETSGSDSSDSDPKAEPPVASISGCPENHAVFSIQDLTLTIPVIRVPLISLLGEQPTGEIQIMGAVLQLVEGTAERFVLKELVQLNENVSDSEVPCGAAEYSVSDGNLSIPYVDVPVIAPIGGKMVEIDTKVYQVNMKWLPLISSVTFVAENINQLQ